MNDLEIARSFQLKPIGEISRRLGVDEEDLIQYGSLKAKIRYSAVEKARQRGRKPGRLILVSAITPTPAGEGKTTLSIGLAQALARLGKRSVVALREPSMGPLFGMKGGATGGGYSQVAPREGINLHFTGDFPAVSAAHNLLAAALDNAVYFRKLPELDPTQITFPRVMDINDRSLRRMVIGLGGKRMGVPRENHFDITAASEVMAILSLSRDYTQLRNRLEKILVGMSYEGEPITAASLGVSGAMTALLRDALHPNLVQTLEGVPALVHCGPFANIAHGSSSILATQMALYYGEYAITEAGFGFDLGAEKFFHITCREGEFSPAVCVLVVTVRALKMHGGVSSASLTRPDPGAVQRGLPNMEKHMENIHKFGVPVVVAINRFAEDTDEEHQVILDRCRNLGVAVSVASVYEKGGQGGEELAATLLETLANRPHREHRPLYDLSWSLEEKIKTVAREMYGAEHVDYTSEGRRDLQAITDLGFDRLPVCIAKTQKSLSDNPELLGRPRDFVVTVRRIEMAAGAGYAVPLTGDILRMPGMPENPAFERIHLNDDGTMEGF